MFVKNKSTFDSLTRYTFKCKLLPILKIPLNLSGLSLNVNVKISHSNHNVISEFLVYINQNKPT